MFSTSNTISWPETSCQWRRPIMCQRGETRHTVTPGCSRLHSNSWRGWRGSWSSLTDWDQCRAARWVGAAVLQVTFRTLVSPVLIKRRFKRWVVLLCESPKTQGGRNGEEGWGKLLRLGAVGELSLTLRLNQQQVLTCFKKFYFTSFWIQHGMYSSTNRGNKEWVAAVVAHFSASLSVWINYK